PYRPIPRWRERNLAEIEGADQVIVPSEYVLGTFLAHGVPRGKITVIPFGVDVGRFSPPEERPESPVRFLFVGQIGVRKGVHYLLEAWQRLALPDAELILAGRVQSNSWPALAHYGDLPGVRWVGHVDPVDLYRSAHVFVFPSLDEGSALVTYEAMAAGLPLIVTGASGSLARDGVEGVLVPARDVDSNHRDRAALSGQGVA
ncbi:MAG: glycosyltransferase family 4 protein, partial [Anaerolineae bacterium]|nr:glycosyltransferase family 4 protein [Anaerolineae bacterium]